MKREGFHKITEKALEVLKNKYKNNNSKLMVFPEYDTIISPFRKTILSAGYDVPLPIEITLEAYQTKYFCLGVEVHMPENYILLLASRSSNDTTVKLENMISIIDADYVNTTDEETGEKIGAIYLPLKNFSGKRITLPKGTSIIQGVFLPFGIFEESSPVEERNGGFGSTGK